MHAPYSAVAATTNEVIHTNKKHPFFTEEQGFLPVAQLKIGMHVLRADGRYGAIIGYKIVPGSAVMYNLEVQQDHTFTVGSGEWVVHNDCGNVVKYLDRNGVGRFAYMGDASAELRNQFAPDIARIEQGSVLSQFRHDGTIFQNMEGILPDKPAGYYREWVVPTAGVNGPGAQRIITGGILSGGRYESMYFTPWHYTLGFFKLY